MSEERAQLSADEAAGGAHRVSDAPRPGDPDLVAIGIGGRIELVGDHVRLIKGGVVGYLVELLWLGHGVLETSIAVEEITAIEIVETLLKPRYIRFNYAGSRSPKGHFLSDALAENALVMNLFDNRGFYRIKARIEERQSLTLGAALRNAGPVA